MSTWKRDAASGLAVLVPIIVTLYIVYWVYARIANIPLLANAIPDPRLRVVVTLTVFVLLVFAIGYLMRTAIGSLVEGIIDDSANHVPGIRVVYNASKMAIETALSGTDDLQRPVKVELWGGLRMTAFKTGKQTADGRQLLFLPTSPNITSGFVIEVEPEDIIETTESVEEALTRILSAGFGEERKRGVPIEVEERDGTPAATDEVAMADGSQTSGDDRTRSTDG